LGEKEDPRSGFSMTAIAHATIRLVSDDGPSSRDCKPARSGAAAVLKSVGSQHVQRRPFADVSEETLVEATLRGESWAQREVWYRFAPMVHGLLRRSLSSRHDVDDLLQEVFLRVFRRLDSIEKASALRSFIYSFGVRVVSEEIRHFQVVQRAHAQLAFSSADAKSTACDFEARDSLWRIQRLLDGMKDKYRAVFVLRHVEGLELQEIAAGLGISLASVKRYLVSALRTIKRAVAADHELKDALGISASNLDAGEGS
jgi:RNA polymerase sigma-70 factor, ECF subfamily